LFHHLIALNLRKEISHEQRASRLLLRSLADRLAGKLCPDYVRVPRGSLQSDDRLSNYGLDSMFSLALTTDIEDFTGVSLPTTVVWDHATLGELTTAVMHAAASLFQTRYESGAA
jgi:acyl carrier protein